FVRFAVAVVPRILRAPSRSGAPSATSGLAKQGRRLRARRDREPSIPSRARRQRDTSSGSLRLRSHGNRPRPRPAGFDERYRGIRGTLHRSRRAGVVGHRRVHRGCVAIFQPRFHCAKPSHRNGLVRGWPTSLDTRALSEFGGSLDRPPRVEERPGSERGGGTVDVCREFRRGVACLGIGGGTVAVWGATCVLSSFGGTGW